MVSSDSDEVVLEAIAPGFTLLDRANERMAVVVPMSPGVAILRVVAAANHPTHEARAEVHPGVT